MCEGVVGVFGVVGVQASIGGLLKPSCPSVCRISFEDQEGGACQVRGACAEPWNFPGWSPKHSCRITPEFDMAIYATHFRFDRSRAIGTDDPDFGLVLNSQIYSFESGTGPQGIIPQEDILWSGGGSATWRLCGSRLGAQCLFACLLACLLA